MITWVKHIHRRKIRSLSIYNVLNCRISLLSCRECWKGGNFPFTNISHSPIFDFIDALLTSREYAFPIPSPAPVTTRGKNKFITFFCSSFHYSIFVFQNFLNTNVQCSKSWAKSANFSLFLVFSKEPASTNQWLNTLYRKYGL